MRKTVIFAFLATMSGISQAHEPLTHLDSIMTQGELNICTTGDYKPYSYRRDDGDYEGIDISMARSLADSLGVKVRWVQTSWKTLMPDLIAGKCDIAVGGISVTLERQKKAFFSQVLNRDGKIPFVRCEDHALYQTIDQINQPSVRLIEPEGGTNEIFARSFLPNAKLTLFADNVTIFQELLDKKADVMITDASEALYQQKRNPGLCAVNPGNFMQYGEKAYLLPRDDITWKLYVDQWLHLTKATGKFEQITNQWLAKPEQ